MLTLHAADVAWTPDGPLAGGAVAADGELLLKVGEFAALAGEFPHARTRRWPGLLTPGLRHPAAGPLLEAAYHPDPREAGELGTEPLPAGEVGMDDARWGASARRGAQRLLAHGVTAVAGPFRRPAVRAALHRLGLTELPSSEGDLRAGYDPLPLLAPPAVFAGALVPGVRADLAVFDVPTSDDPLAALAGHGAGTCVATVLRGRLVHRRR